MSFHRQYIVFSDLVFYDLLQESLVYHYVLVPDGVGLYLAGNQLANYSIVNLEDIGEEECALICYTNSPDCCESVWPKAGEWYFPNGSAVSIEGDMKDFYRSRDSMVVRLNRRYNAVSPTGLYCCDIPDSNGNLCVGAYHLGGSKATILVIVMIIHRQ